MCNHYIKTHAIYNSTIAYRDYSYYVVNCNLEYCIRITGITNINPNSVTTTVDQETSITFTCEAEWIRGVPNSLIPDRFCELVLSLDVESAENLTRQLGLSLEWEIDGTGPFISTDALTPTLIQRGIIITTTCSFNAEQVLHILDLELGDQESCEHNLTPDMIPRCTSIINITRQATNSNVQLQCSVQPSHDQCDDGEYMRTSERVYLQLQGM